MDFFEALSIVRGHALDDVAKAPELPSPAHTSDSHWFLREASPSHALGSTLRPSPCEVQLPNTSARHSTQHHHLPAHPSRPASSLGLLSAASPAMPAPTNAVARALSSLGTRSPRPSPPLLPSGTNTAAARPSSPQLSLVARNDTGPARPASSLALMTLSTPTSTAGTPTSRPKGRPKSSLGVLESAGELADEVEDLSGWRQKLRLNVRVESSHYNKPVVFTPHTHSKIKQVKTSELAVDPARSAICRSPVTGSRTAALRRERSFVENFVPESPSRAPNTRARTPLSHTGVPPTKSKAPPPTKARPKTASLEAMSSFCSSPLPSEVSKYFSPSKLQEPSFLKRVEDNKPCSLTKDELRTHPLFSKFLFPDLPEKEHKLPHRQKSYFRDKYIPQNTIAWMKKRGRKPKLPVKARHEKDLNTIFSFLDQDGSGTIDSDELFTVFQILGYGHTKAELLAMMADVDTEGKGALNLHEFTQLMVRNGMLASSSSSDTSASGLSSFPLLAKTYQIRSLVRGVCKDTLAEEEVDEAEQAAQARQRMMRRRGAEF